MQSQFNTTRDPKFANIELTNIWKNLKSKYTHVQEEASHKLFEYLQKHSEQTDEIFKDFHRELQGQRKEEKFGIFSALNEILKISHETQIVSHVNKIIPDVRAQLDSNNNTVEFVQKCAICLGNLAKSGGNITAKNIEETLQKAIDWLQMNQKPNNTDMRKYAAVMVLRQFAEKLPVITFNKLFGPGSDFMSLFQCFDDHRENVRLESAQVIHFCIKHISDRQQKKGTIKETVYIYNEVKKAFKPGCDPNYQHSALTVLGSLMASEGTLTDQGPGGQGQTGIKSIEIIQQVERLLKESKSTLVKKKCIDLIPSMYRYIPNHYANPQNLESIINCIFDYIKNAGPKDRGQGFRTLGKLSVRAEPRFFEKYVLTIFKMIYSEIQKPIKLRDGTLKPNVEPEALTCLTFLLKNHGTRISDIYHDKMYDLITDIFYSGFNMEVIECLSGIARIKRGLYKRACQVKLLNSCSIVLTQKLDKFPQHLEEQFQPPSQSGEMRETIGRSTSNESIAVVANFGGNREEEKVQSSTPRSTTSLAFDNDYDANQSQSNSAANIKAFYVAVLSENNQKFLYELVKQSLATPTDKQNDDKQAQNERTNMVTIALKTLSIFDFNEYSMCIVYFIERSVLNYLDDENPQIRKLAMQTCCTLHLPQTNQLQISQNIKRIISKLLHRFFVTATTDNETRIRVTMLKHLNAQFDPFISRYENLLMLFNCMQDQSFEIKEWTVRILGRLVPHNASQILPYLRQLIVSLISQLEQSTDGKEREEAVKLIKMFVRHTPELAKAYSNSILLCLIKKLDGERATSSFVSAILNVISEISKINAEAIKPYLGDLFPLILECIKDMTSATKRKEAVRTLISIIENTSFVVKPYFYFPQILDMITYLVQTETNQDIRKLILRLIGSLGAVDPFLVKQIKRSSDEAADTQDVTEIFNDLPQMFAQDENDVGMRNIRKPQMQSKPQQDMESADFKMQNMVAVKQKQRVLITVEELNLSKENKYPAMAIYQLMKVLVDPNMRDHHQVTLCGLIYLLKSQPDSMPFMPMLIPPLMDLLKQNDYALTQDLFNIMTLIVVQMPEALLQFQDPIFEMIHTVINQNSMSKLVLKLLNEINSDVGKHKMFSHMYLVLPEVLSLIENARKQTENKIAEEQQIGKISEKTKNWVELTLSAISSLPLFEATILDDHLYLIIPLLLRTASSGPISEQIIPIQKVAIQTLTSMIKCSSYREFTAQVVHQLLKILEVQSQESDLIDDIINSFSTVAAKLQSDFTPYIQLIQKAIRRNRIQDRCKQFDDSIYRITKKDPIDCFKEHLDQVPLEDLGFQNIDEVPVANPTTTMEKAKSRQGVVNTNEMLDEFDTSKCHIAVDWNEWLTKTSYQLLKQNPSPVLYACASLTEMYAPLASELYNIAFVSCWKHMQDNEKQKIMFSFQQAINKASVTKTTQVLQTILNLAEFMELDEIQDIMFGSSTLAKIAKQCNTLAKALYYWEKEFDNSPSPETIELLVQTNYDLNQPEAAEGILVFARKNTMIEENEENLEKSQKWEESLKKLNVKEETRENRLNIQRSKLNCYSKLMDWSELEQTVTIMWEDYIQEQDAERKGKIRKEIKNAAPDAAYAAWNLQNWETFKKYTRQLDEQKYEKYFYQAVLEIKFPTKQVYDTALKHIDAAREILDAKITSLLGESYNRAYKMIQELQFLTELEEVCHYKATKSEQKKQSLYSCWLQRQKSIPTQDLEAHQKLLNIRCLVIDKKEEIENYIQFAKMAQASTNTELSTRILMQLRRELELSQQNLHMQVDRGANDSNGLTISEQHTKINNNRAKVEIAIADAHQIQGQFTQTANLLTSLINTYPDLEPALQSVCYQKLGHIQFEILESSKQNTFKQQPLEYDSIISTQYEQIVKNCQQAVIIDPNNADAWHYFSTTNEEASIHYSRQFSREFAKDKNKSKEYQLHREFGHNRLPKLAHYPTAEKYIKHVVCIANGLIRQLEISSQVNRSTASGTKSLQTTLRLLKVWFQHGNLPEIQGILKEGIERIDLKVWIEVIPQLLARIDIKDELIRKSLNELLEKISLKFPQALIYSLSVQENSTSNERKKAAKQLMEKLKTTQPVLIEQATTISTELNRSAIVLSEMWQEAIEEASRIYFGRNDGKAMFSYLSPFHKEMEREPETMNEISFYQGYASDLLEAYSWMKLYMRSERTPDINQAWDIYYAIFRRISTKQKEVTFYELRNVAPKLMRAVDLEIAVPGTFKSNKPIVKISKFASVLPVLPSKQHPRKMSVYGSDGREYLLLLKGHEDIRQDERVMQLFGLVNTLLHIDQQTSKKDLSIRRYPVIPLSQNTGLIGWVPNCDTLHILIKEHRTENNIIPNIEYKLMEQMCEHFEICPLPNKVEIFRNALEKTLGEDLQKVLWVKSQNSEVWLDRRTNYTRSLAVMSMVGYILGLGDRHPSNIMLERHTGKIVHIDFGDCFEIAMRREKFPEKIPFRLTRMLIKAMEVSGIEGNFRTTCENTMRVMRESKESLLAIMEAFVYDPLISFRLLNPKMFKKHKEDVESHDKKAELDAVKIVAQPLETHIDPIEIIAMIDENKAKEVRSQIVDKVIERLQSTTKGSIFNKYAESKFSRHVEDMELMRLMQTEEEEVRQKELNTIAEIVIERITYKLRGLEFTNTSAQKAPQEVAEAELQKFMSGYGGQKLQQRMNVNDQVDILIKAATNHENLSSVYIGWCPYW